MLDAQGCLREDPGDPQQAQRFLELLARASATAPLQDQAMLVLVLRRSATQRRRRKDGNNGGASSSSSSSSSPTVFEHFTRWGGLEVLKGMLGDGLARREQQQPGSAGAKEATEMLELVLKTLLVLPSHPEAAKDANLPRFVKAMFAPSSAAVQQQQQQQAQAQQQQQQQQQQQ